MLRGKPPFGQASRPDSSVLGAATWVTGCVWSDFASGSSLPDEVLTPQTSTQQSTLAVSLEFRATICLPDAPRPAPGSPRRSEHQARGRVGDTRVRVCHMLWPEPRQPFVRGRAIAGSSSSDSLLPCCAGGRTSREVSLETASGKSHLAVALPGADTPHSLLWGSHRACEPRRQGGLGCSTVR